MDAQEQLRKPLVHVHADGSRGPTAPHPPLLSRVALRSLTRRERVALALGGLFVVALIGLLDFVTPTVVSLAVLYVVVIIATTLFAGVRAGMVTAAGSAVAWAIGDSAARSQGAWTLALNATLRSLALGIVVVLVSHLVRALRAAHESNRQSREFLATAAHQLRTPIAGLRTTADALLSIDASPRQEQLLANLANESARAGRLITSLLRVARLDQGEPLRREPVDVRNLLIAELERTRHLCTLDLRLANNCDDAPVTWIDVQATRDVLANLLDNARRHAHSMIEITVEQHHDEIRVILRDDGPGLPSGHEDKAFERFVSLDGHGGSGLGLPIARSLARVQGGELAYRDRAFILSIPSAPHHVSDRVRPGPSIGGSEPARTRPVET